MTTLSIVTLALAALNLLLLVILWRRSVAAGAERAVREELRASREEAARAARDLREEVGAGLKSAAAGISVTIGEMGKTQSGQLEAVRGTVDAQLRSLQESNEKRLAEMQKTVDEKLQGTLERRLTESFKLVGDQLGEVQKGLGEMRSLATGVGDLKRVLTNVRTRGTWGEVQLGALLEQLLTPDQYDRNVKTNPETNELVEFAIKLPGPDDRAGACVWLPIDAKFPQEDYQRLLDAVDAGDPERVARCTADLGRAARTAAQKVHDKYLSPGRTTEFAIMFLPTEGLYAEILRQPGLCDDLQQNCHVTVAGPTTLAAVLNALRMGFRTLAIEQRSSEVWRVLAAVKGEFRKFGDVLDKVGKHLHAAHDSIEGAGVRTRAMERKLREVEELPAGSAAALLGLPETDEETPEDAEPAPSPTDSRRP